MKNILMAVVTVFSFAAVADEKPVVLRILNCKGTIEKIDAKQNPVQGSKQTLEFSIQETRIDYTEPFEFPGYKSHLVMADPSQASQTLYGDFTTDGGGTDYEQFRDGQPDDNWAGFAWYSLTPDKDDLGNEDVEIARLFLRSVEEQRGKAVRRYHLAIQFHDLSNDERPLKFGYQSTDLVICNVK